MHKTSEWKLTICSCWSFAFCNDMSIISSASFWASSIFFCLSSSLCCCLLLLTGNKKIHNLILVANMKIHFFPHSKSTVSLVSSLYSILVRLSRFFWSWGKLRGIWNEEIHWHGWDSDPDTYFLPRSASKVLRSLAPIPLWLSKVVSRSGLPFPGHDRSGSQCYSRSPHEVLFQALDCY